VKTARDLIYVENTNGGTVSIIDSIRLEVVGEIEVGHHPDDVIASPGGEIIYVNRQETRDVVAVDTVSHSILWNVELDGMPHHLGITPDGRLLYVALFDQSVDAVIDTKSHAVVAQPATGWGTHGVFRSPGGERFYIGSMFLDMISVVDVATWSTLRAIPMREGVRPFAITSDERRLYAQLSRVHGFDVVDLETDEVILNVDLPSLPPEIRRPRFFPHTVNHGLKITPDDRKLLAAASIAGYVALYALPECELIDTVPVGAEPSWIVLSSDTSLAFVSNRAEGTVSVIDIDARTEVARVKVGSYPQRMTVAPQGLAGSEG
jgi:YVTN family beta-propeller protein